MSLLHPNVDDAAFALSHADAGHRAALNRAWRLQLLLERILGTVGHVLPPDLRVEVQVVISADRTAEADDGIWRTESPDPWPPSGNRR